MTDPASCAKGPESHGCRFDFSVVIRKLHDLASTSGTHLLISQAPPPTESGWDAARIIFFDYLNLYGPPRTCPAERFAGSTRFPEYDTCTEDPDPCPPN
jgi:hypothetical protein